MYPHQNNINFNFPNSAPSLQHQYQQQHQQQQFIQPQQHQQQQFQPIQQLPPTWSQQPKQQTVISQNNHNMTNGMLNYQQPYPPQQQVQYQQQLPPKYPQQQPQFHQIPQQQQYQVQYHPQTQTQTQTQTQVQEGQYPIYQQQLMASQRSGPSPVPQMQNYGNPSTASMLHQQAQLLPPYQQLPHPQQVSDLDYQQQQQQQMRPKKKFSTQEKLDILSEMEKEGLSMVLQRYSLHANMLVKWKKSEEQLRQSLTKDSGEELPQSKYPEIDQMVYQDYLALLQTNTKPTNPMLLKAAKQAAQSPFITTKYGESVKSARFGQVWLAKFKQRFNIVSVPGPGLPQWQPPPAATAAVAAFASQQQQLQLQQQQEEGASDNEDDNDEEEDDGLLDDGDDSDEDEDEDSESKGQQQDSSRPRGLANASPATITPAIDMSKPIVASMMFPQPNPNIPSTLPPSTTSNVNTNNLNTHVNANSKGAAQRANVFLGGVPQSKQPQQSKLAQVSTATNATLTTTSASYPPLAAALANTLDTTILQEASGLSYRGLGNPSVTHGALMVIDGMRVAEQWSTISKQLKQLLFTTDLWNEMDGLQRHHTKRCKI